MSADEEVRALKGQLEAAYKALDIANEIITELKGKVTAAEASLRRYEMSKEEMERIANG